MGALGDLLRANLEQLEKPGNYESLRERLASIKLNRDPVRIKESPENISGGGVRERTAGG
jgi:hypothetical protein